MSLSNVITEVKMAKWDRKYRCDTKGKQLYTKFIKNRFNRVRRHLKAADVQEWIDGEIEAHIEAEDAFFDELERQEEEKLFYWEELAEDNRWDEWDRMDDYDDYDDFWEDEDPYYSKLQAWERFEADQAIEDAQDDLEWAFSGEWMKEIEAA